MERFKSYGDERKVQDLLLKNLQSSGIYCKEGTFRDTFDIYCYLESTEGNRQEPSLVLIDFKVYKGLSLEDLRTRYSPKAPPRRSRDSPNWEYLKSEGLHPPTRDALSFLMELEHLNVQAISDLVGVDIKSVIGWLSKPGSKTATCMPYAHWELLLLKLGRHPSKKLVDIQE